jgi:hypothetical protein
MARLVPAGFPETPRVYIYAGGVFRGGNSPVSPVSGSFGEFRGKGKVRKSQPDTGLLKVCPTY